MNLRRHIIYRLHQRRAYGSKHLGKDVLLHSGVPSHLRGEVRKELDALIREGIVIYYDKGREAIQLNIEKTEEIRKILEEEDEQQ